MMDIADKLPPSLRDVFNNFYQSEQDDMKKMDEAVKKASQDQDNPDSDSSQQTS
ncbi:MAG: hypothetical protein K1X28_06160 [Parachlamydiales bacterium]|nr:hypothetical protein [Parachlamydiales bacterium]